MSKSNGQDCYLQNLPSNLNEYGLNKTLITRALSISLESIYNCIEE